MFDSPLYYASLLSLGIGLLVYAIFMRRQPIAEPRAIFTASAPEPPDAAIA